MSLCFSEITSYFPSWVFVSYNRSSFRSPHQSTLCNWELSSRPTRFSISCGHIIKAGFKCSEVWYSSSVFHSHSAHWNGGGAQISIHSSLGNQWPVLLGKESWIYEKWLPQGQTEESRYSDFEVLQTRVKVPASHLFSLRFSTNTEGQALVRW